MTMYRIHVLRDEENGTYWTGNDWGPYSSAKRLSKHHAAALSQEIGGLVERCTFQATHDFGNRCFVCADRIQLHSYVAVVDPDTGVFAHGDCLPPELVEGRCR